MYRPGIRKCEITPQKTPNYALNMFLGQKLIFEKVDFYYENGQKSGFGDLELGSQLQHYVVS